MYNQCYHKKNNKKNRYFYYYPLIFFYFYKIQIVITYVVYLFIIIGRNHVDVPLLNPSSLKQCDVCCETNSIQLKRYGPIGDLVVRRNSSPPKLERNDRSWFQRERKLKNDQTNKVESSSQILFNQQLICWWSMFNIQYHFYGTQRLISCLKRVVPKILFDNIQ